MAAEQILIEFLTDSSQLTPAIDILEKMGQIDSKTADAFKKTNAELAKRTDVLKKVTSEEGKQIKTLQDVDKAVNSLTNSFTEGFKEGVAGVFAEAGVSVEDFENALKGLNITTDKTEGSQASLKKKLRDMVQQLALLESQGKRNTQEYADLVAKAGELKDAIGDANDAIKNAGSDTRAMDNVVSLAGGVAGAFTVASGAAALFGQENEELQKSFQQISIVMQMLQGIQQIADLASQRRFQTLSALIGVRQVEATTIVAQTEATTAAAVATEAEAAAAVEMTVATEAQTVATAEVTIATRIWNSVLAMNPLLLIATLVTVVVAAYKAFFSSAENSAKAQKHLNEQLEEGIKWNEISIQAVAKAGHVMETSYKARNASAEEFRKLNENVLQRQIKIATDFEQKNRAAYDAVDERLRLHNTGAKKLTDDEYKNNFEFWEKFNAKQKEGFDLTQQLQDLKTSNAADAMRESLVNQTAFADALVLLQKEGSRNELEAQIAAIRARENEELKSAAKLPGEIARIRAQANRDAGKVKNEIQIFDLTEEKALLEKHLANVKEGTVQELELRKELAAKQNAIDAAQSTLTAKQKSAIIEKGAQEQKEFDRQIAQRRIEIEINGINTKLAKAKEGSTEEYLLNIDLLQAQYSFDLKQKGLTSDKKLLLDAEYLKKLADLNRQQSLKDQADALGTKESDINSRLYQQQIANVSDFNQAVVDLKKKAIDIQAQQAEQAARDQLAHGTLSETRFAERIHEINLKAVADKQALTNTAYTQDKQTQLNLNNLILENEKKRLEIQLASSDLSLKGRIEARRRIKAISREEIDNEAANLEDLHKHGAIKEEEYQNRLQVIKGKYLDLDLQKAQEYQQRKNEIINAGFSMFKEVSDAIFEIDASNRQASLDADLRALSDRREAELNNKNLTENQKAEIDKRFQAQENQIKKRAFEADKQAKKEQAIINGALAITNILATMPKFDFGIASALAIAAAVVSTTIQVAKINSTKYTGFRGGGYTGNKGRDDVAGFVHGQEYVAHAEATKRYRPALEAMNRLEFDKYIASHIPSVDPEELSSYSIGPNGIEFDYEKLGKSIAKYVPEPVQNNLSLDKDGLSFHLIEKGNKTTIRNNRYKTT